MRAGGAVRGHGRQPAAQGGGRAHTGAEEVQAGRLQHREYMIDNGLDFGWVYLYFEIKAQYSGLNGVFAVSPKG